MQKFIVGLTGPTGSGKSTAREVAAELGFFCIDADKVARDATAKGSPLLPILKKEFGDILNPDGSLNRGELAKKAFCNKESTERLNSIMLPHIVGLIEDIIKCSESNLILLDAPTLFESGANKICQKTVGVVADENIRLNRIMARDNLLEDAAKLRISAGKPQSFYEENCNYILTNNATADGFILSAKELFTKLKQEAV